MVEYGRDRWNMEENGRTLHQCTYARATAELWVSACDRLWSSCILKITDSLLDQFMG